MRRRGLLAALPAMLAARQASAAPGDIAFNVMRSGSQVGTHTVRFRQQDGLLQAHSMVRIEVKLLSFTVFRYLHEVDETWRGGRLAGLASRLDKNGSVLACEARSDAQGLILRGPQGETRLPAGAAPLTWWRRDSLRPGVPLFDPRKALLVDPQLRTSRVPAGTRIELIGGEGADILYDPAGTWTGFATTGDDGSAVRYEPA